MKIIYNSPEDFLTENLWLIPTIRENTLELNENGTFKVVNNIPIIRSLATPSLSKTISRLIYLIKDKMVMFKKIEKADWLKNLFNYMHEKYFNKANNNYYRAKKAWYRMIGDLFEDIKNWNFKKVRGKVISLLRVLSPILVFDVHNITKWNHTKTFAKFIEELTKNDIVVIIRCPIEAIDYAKKLLFIPKENLKIKFIDFTIPLTDEAIEVFKELEKIKASEYVFYSPQKNKPISETTLRKYQNNIAIEHNITKQTLHGIRHTFATLTRQYLQKEHNIQDEVIEIALQHLDKNRIRAVYNHYDYFKERKELLNLWNEFLNNL